MMNIVKRVWRRILPVEARNYIYHHLRYPMAKAQKQREILTYLQQITNSGGGDDLDDVISYLKKHSLETFPYDFRLKYDANPYYEKTFFDSQAERFYVLYKNRKIYMKKGWSKEQAASYFNGLMEEQDEDSPHHYGFDELKLSGDEVVVDAGAAEGIVTAELVDRVAKVYAFDMDREWLECLRLTFADTDKVVIVPKGLGGKAQGDITTLDDYFKDERVDLIKADIEGAECDTVRGGQNTLRGVKTAVFCTYHRQGDAEELKGLFEGLGFETAFSRGYMIFEIGDLEKLVPPYLRHGLIFATRSEHKEQL